MPFDGRESRNLPPGRRWLCGKSPSQQRTTILRSDKFCEIGPAGACMADYLEHIAPKSPQKYRLESNIFSELIVNQAFKLAQSSQIGFPVPPCSDGSPDPPERHCPDPPGLRPAGRLWLNQKFACASPRTHIGLRNPAACVVLRFNALIVRAMADIAAHSDFSRAGIP